LTPRDGDDEATVVLRPARRPRRRWGRPLVALAGLAALGGIAWWVQRPAAPPPAPPRPVAVIEQPPPPPPPPRIAVVAADEAAILASQPTSLLVFRYAPAPRVLVLAFPSLRAQGRMLNRIGAFVEKAGLPHARVIAEAELGEALQRSRDTEETFYYGHDYRAADMARFFAAAARDGTALRPEEAFLRDLLDQEGLLAPAANGAMISIPPATDSPPIDAAARETILRHELSHGLYFTDPGYAAYAARFWDTVLTDGQRSGFRRFLAAQDYDTDNTDLMINETQAYLMYTADRRYFRPEMAGLTTAEAGQLRRTFWLGMPPGWLKDATDWLADAH
jgi:hypothetical protein